jgi:hypothetical protein
MIPDPEGRVSAKCAAVFRKDRAQNKEFMLGHTKARVHALCPRLGFAAIALL